MRVTIHGRRYDTDRAIKVATSTEDPTKVNWMCYLYRTPKVGRYFLHGSGGSMTIFQGKEKIIPISAVEAENWQKRYCRP